MKSAVLKEVVSAAIINPLHHHLPPTSPMSVCVARFASLPPDRPTSPNAHVATLFIAPVATNAKCAAIKRYHPEEQRLMQCVVATAISISYPKTNALVPPMMAATIISAPREPAALMGSV
jgi:hypothetical protein